MSILFAVIGRLLYVGLFAFAGYILYFNFVQLPEFVAHKNSKSGNEYFETLKLRGPAQYVIDLNVSKTSSSTAKIQGEMFLHLDGDLKRRKPFKKKQSDSEGTATVKETLRYVLNVAAGQEHEVVLEGKTKKGADWNVRVLQDPPENYEIFERLKIVMAIIALIVMIVVEALIGLI